MNNYVLESLVIDDIALETGFLAFKYTNTQEVIVANELYNNSKKLYKFGEKEKALTYMKKARSLYEKALGTLLNSGKFTKTEITNRNVSQSRRYTTVTTDKMTFSIARHKLENKIDRCTAHILKWTKNNQSDYQDLLNQVKADRDHAEAVNKSH